MAGGGDLPGKSDLRDTRQHRYLNRSWEKAVPVRGTGKPEIPGNLLRWYQIHFFERKYVSIPATISAIRAKTA
jgi:hypothetical protein